MVWPGAKWSRKTMGIGWVLDRLQDEQSSFGQTWTGPERKSGFWTAEEKRSVWDMCCKSNIMWQLTGKPSSLKPLRSLTLPSMIAPLRPLAEAPVDMRSPHSALGASAGPEMNRTLSGGAWSICRHVLKRSTCQQNIVTMQVCIKNAMYVVALGR